MAPLEDHVITFIVVIFDFLLHTYDHYLSFASFYNFVRLLSFLSVEFSLYSFLSRTAENGTSEETDGPSVAVRKLFSTQKAFL